MTVPTLEQVDSRLRALAHTVTLSDGDAHAIALLTAFQAVPPDSRRRSRRVGGPVRVAGAIAVVVIAVLALNIVAVYFAPRYGHALADAPGIGPISSRMLHAVGLNGEDVTVFGEVATSSGHTLKLEGGFADGLRMVLFVSIDGKGLDGNPKGYGMQVGDWGLANYTLSDQFGHRYDPILVGGSNVVQFQPLAWPASQVGGRLTFHVTAIEAQWMIPFATLSGDWTMHATLVGRQAHNLPLPTPVRTADALYNFTAVQASDKTLIVRWTVQGVVNDRIDKLWIPGPAVPSDAYRQLVRDYFSPAIYDASGRQVQWEEYGTELPKDPSGLAKGQITVFIPGPGQYRIQLGAALTAPELQRWIVVP
jgi:hypothetical protein